MALKKPSLLAPSRLDSLGVGPSMYGTNVNFSRTGVWPSCLLGATVAWRPAKSRVKTLGDDFSTGRIQGMMLQTKMSD